MSYIKKEPLLQKAKELLRDDAFGGVRIVREMENAPAEDVVEVDRLDLILKLQHDKSLENLRKYIQNNDIVKVTRCKDCKFFKYGDYCVEGKMEHSRCQENDFCSYGERRTDND